MKLSLSWLKSYLDLPETPQQIAEALTLAGIEVDGVHPHGQDIIFEVSLTPNLGHCLSVIGIARELGAIFNRRIKRHLVQFQEKKGDLTKNAIKVSIEDAEGCPHFSCRLVRGVRIGPSPDWLREHLEACGMRSINNAVDVGNYVMLETGHPLHMFDYDKLAGHHLYVRPSKGKVRIKTLDEIERDIPDNVLLIYDDKEPVSIAGVMGGFGSAVSENTQNILIESAYFPQSHVRRSSKLLSLRTEGSARWERGVDPLDTLSSLERAVELLIQVAGGHASEGAVDEVKKRFERKVLKCRPSRANQLLGTALSQNEVVGLLKRLEIEIVSEKENLIEVRVPSYRHDLNQEIDLIEEIGRIFGYNNIPRRIPKHASSPLPDAPLFVFEEEMRQTLISLRLQECLTCDLISPQLATLTAEKIQGNDAQIAVLHPASIDQSILRTSLLPGLLQVVKFNLDRQNESLALFEVGHIHFKQKSNYYEQSAAAIVLAGKSAPPHFETKDREVDFLDLKGIVEDLFSSLGLHNSSFEPAHLQNFHPGRQARVKMGDSCLGFLGEVHPAHLKELGIEERVYFAEINLHDLYPLYEKHRATLRVKPLPAFPGSIRDWTISLPEHLPIDEIFKAAYSLASPLLSRLALIDLYKSEKIGKDRKNATLRFTYRDLNKTVEFQEVEAVHGRLTAHIQEQLRGLL